MSECVCNVIPIDDESEEIKYCERIVRCGDCTHFREVRMSGGTAKTVCSGVMAYVEPDPMGFCAWGERMGEA